LAESSGPKRTSRGREIRAPARMGASYDMSSAAVSVQGDDVDDLHMSMVSTAGRPIRAVTYTTASPSRPDRESEESMKDSEPDYGDDGDDEHMPEDEDDDKDEYDDEDEAMPDDDLGDVLPSKPLLVVELPVNAPVVHSAASVNYYGKMANEVEMTDAPVTTTRNEHGDAENIQPNGSNSAARLDFKTNPENVGGGIP